MDSSQPFLPLRIERIISNFRTTGTDKTEAEPRGLGFMRSVQPVAQQGPQCGLVALCMASDMVAKAQPVSAELIFEEAKRLAITNYGEMFSVHWFAKLASSIYPCSKATVVEIRKQPNKYKLIAEALLDLKCILIAYDADKNNEPCLNNGHNAHWAIITGFLIVDSQSQPAFSDSTCNCLKRDDNTGIYWFRVTGPCLAHKLALSSFLSTIDFDFDLSDREHLYVLALHGKSKHVAVWPLAKLLLSNDNLREISSKRINDGLEYKVPVEGVEFGLAGKMLVLE